MFTGYRQTCIFAACSEGWKEFSSSCFKLGEDKKTWADAEIKCVEEGGHLASVESNEENWNIQGLLKDIQDPVWLGGSDAGAEGTWVFTDGTALTHTAGWSDGQPDDWAASQNCLATNLKGPDWDDAGCGENYNFMCEKKKGDGECTLNLWIQYNFLARATSL